MTGVTESITKTLGSGSGIDLKALVTSLVAEGVFEAFPTLKIVLIEGGFVWLPSLAWRLDKHWKRLKAEVSGTLEEERE